jgi:hypothetical protein
VLRAVLTALRRLLIALPVAAAVIAVGLAGTAGARTPKAASYAYGARGQAPQLTLRAGQAPSGFTGGPVAAADGETVNVFVEDALLAADPTAGQRWADVLAGLLHGPEFSSVTVYLATLDRVRQICGQGALGCYGQNRLVAIGEDLRGVTAQSVVTHEYGHHVANSRLNDPWPAVDWGTKRWATYLNVCKRTQAGELVPGDEGRFYQLNPGEVFAEDYRVLNERRAGLPEARWEVVDESLYPDQTALDLLAQDVTAPWTGATTTRYRVVLGLGASGRGLRVPTLLDGNFTATLTSPAKARFTLRVVDLASGKVLAADATGLRTKTLTVSICGQRSLQVQVKRVSGSGTFSLAVSKP